MANATKKYTLSEEYTRTDEEKQHCAFVTALTIWKGNKDAVKMYISSSRRAGDMITHRFLKQYANAKNGDKENALIELFLDNQRKRAQVFTENVASNLNLDRMMQSLDESVESGKMDEQFYLLQSDGLKELYECKQRFNERVGV